MFSLGLLAVAGQSATPMPRQFIAHRGVNLRSTLAGENSLEAIRYASRAGFAAIETDVRLTADGHLVIMHDDTLNRTCLNTDGAEIKQQTPVASKTLSELKAEYILKASEPRNRTQIPVVREYLTECKKHGLLPFIEPKLNDDTGKHYRDIVLLANEVMGSGNYVITSNNRANLVIRKIGLREVPLMGILYQTTFEEIAGLGGAIMAISSSQFTEAEFAAHMARAVAAHIPTESHADNYLRFALIDSHDVNFVSTDFLAPDLKHGVVPLRQFARFDEFAFTGRIQGSLLRLSRRESLSLESSLPEIHFGGIYLELEMKGECHVHLANQEFTLSNPAMRFCRHQLMVQNVAPVFKILATEECEMRSVKLTLVEF